VNNISLLYKHNTLDELLALTVLRALNPELTLIREDAPNLEAMFSLGYRHAPEEGHWKDVRSVWDAFGAEYLKVFSTEIGDYMDTKIRTQEKLVRKITHPEFDEVLRLLQEHSAEAWNHANLIARVVLKDLVLQSTKYVIRNKPDKGMFKYTKIIVVDNRVFSDEPLKEDTRMYIAEPHIGICKTPAIAAMVAGDQ